MRPNRLTLRPFAALLALTLVAASQLPAADTKACEPAAVDAEAEKQATAATRAP